jgi:excinuclease ABC subunit C
LPSEPGVYWFSGKDGVILYVGKAKKLKNRIKSYTQFAKLGGRTQQLVKTAHSLNFQILGSELEALLVEAELIHTHQPKYNILLKDDKTPLYIHITKEEFPRVLTLRKQEIIKYDPKGTILGPFPSAFKVKEVLRLVRKIFKWCQKPLAKKSCFYHQIELCSGACIDDISAEEYNIDIKNLILFLRGKKKIVLRNLKKEMLSLAEKEKFEKAQQIKEQIELIDEVTNTRLKPNLTLPQLKLTQAEEAITHLKKMLKDYAGIPQTSPLTTLEGYDVSNISGTDPSVSLVTFTDGLPDKSKYKLFNIKSLQTPNDYAMMAEALTRRQKHPEWGKPDLLVIDGGKGQVRSVLKVWNWNNPVIGLVKNPDRVVIPITKKEGLDLKNPTYKIIKLPENHPTLKLLQQIRDESHRFARKQHRKLRLKSLFN